MKKCSQCKKPTGIPSIEFENKSYCMSCTKHMKQIMDAIRKATTIPEGSICLRCGKLMKQPFLYFGMFYCEPCYDIKLEDHHILGEYFLEGLRNS